MNKPKQFHKNYNFENKLVAVDTRDMTEESIKELENLIIDNGMDYNVRDLDVIQELEEEVCICIPKYDD
tara:strand:- start:315 stop:521 length:207 start_codon:yes stop_codon:yes gene_type:complete